MTGGEARRVIGPPIRFRSRGRSARELLLVKVAFWAIVLGFVLFVAFIFWGLATHEPSPSPFDSSGI